MEFLDALVTHYKEDIYKPFKALAPKFQKVILFGSKKEEIPFYLERAGKKITYKKVFEGVIPTLKRRLAETDSQAVRDDIRQYLNYKPCPKCKGSRLNPASSAVQIGEKHIWELTALSIEHALGFFTSLTLAGQEASIGEPIIKEVEQRLGFLQNVGLGYLTLARPAATLSGGESQRIRLATQIGSKLTGVLYVLDEPSIGLHQRDNTRLLKTLMELRELGNTVLVVEHDEDTIRAADHIIDIGPGAGVNGGKLIFSGSPEELLKSEDSLTGQYLSGRQRIHVPEKRRPGNGKKITVKGASANNLRRVNADFPLGCFTCVTGVSGSGKSTLVLSTLYRAIANQINQNRKPVGKHKEIQGLEQLDKIIHIDQSPIGKTPRSNPLTYTQVFTPIRDLFAKTPEAKAKGYKPGRFSFNMKGGRCEACSGDGIVKI
ncbi:MAG: excinuclease ABC subunit UvrA, partial [Desulfobacterales bacterium]|nr:excinuclease ABC subunit UvrA [Desulfobacterales bacterium]